MRKSKRSRVTGWLQLLIVGACASVTAPLAHAADRAALEACAPPELHAAVVRGLVESDTLARSIAAAPTIEDARALALAPAQSATRALERADSLVPWREPGLERAHTRLARYQRAVTEAADPAAVAAEYEGLTRPRGAGLDGVQVADLGGPAADVHVGNVGCGYSTGEIIAIIIGFILAIIPGIILLIVLC